jgi:hypothetical protein
LSWAHNTFLQKRLIRSVQYINIPVPLLQPARDASLEPSRILGAEEHDWANHSQPKSSPVQGPRMSEATVCRRQRHACIGGRCECVSGCECAPEQHAVHE